MEKKISKRERIKQQRLNCKAGDYFTLSGKYYPDNSLEPLLPPPPEKRALAVRSGNNCRIKPINCNIFFKSS